MIDGVKIKVLKVFKDIPDTPQKETDKLGCLMEVVRNDEDLLKKFGQTTFTITYPGAIKGFHWHKLQDDIWFVATGKAKIVLYDMRETSPTKGETQVIYAGTDDYKVVVIPVGVIHGYKVIGDNPVLMFYHTTESYNAQSPDELRIAYDDPKVNFDWSQD